VSYRHPGYLGTVTCIAETGAGRGLVLTARARGRLKRETAGFFCGGQTMMSSTIPSAKYSCSEFPLTFWNGRRAMEALSGSPGEQTSDPGVPVPHMFENAGDQGPKRIRHSPNRIGKTMQQILLMIALSFFAFPTTAQAITAHHRHKRAAVQQRISI
jgi:hypothetical protein